MFAKQIFIEFGEYFAAIDYFEQIRMHQFLKETFHWL